jgi:hypothetical protein
LIKGLKEKKIALIVEDPLYIGELIKKFFKRMGMNQLKK